MSAFRVDPTPSPSPLPLHLHLTASASLPVEYVPPGTDWGTQKRGGGKWDWKSLYDLCRTARSPPVAFYFLYRTRSPLCFSISLLYVAPPTHLQPQFPVLVPDHRYHHNRTRSGDDPTNSP
ncbi:hypothetical protein D9613_012420 [Agrocybe pediades]|uniref:Uncharacterized protein n=1 Tax=Agrocybe pediades TaxID=84607 RepID=A0A8H4QRY4_9AGAR|nr:hypothetical protein D9613_012420 [Agrocybe pediades]